MGMASVTNSDPDEEQQDCTHCGGHFESVGRCPGCCNCEFDDRELGEAGA